MTAVAGKAPAAFSISGAFGNLTAPRPIPGIIPLPRQQLLGEDIARLRIGHEVGDAAMLRDTAAPLIARK
ncbi:hypothetical protein NI18_14755 [Sphingomonas sp. Ant20]|nr:hypothetical protein NI18_14755 [Sphingomonas sp. Ant20]